MKQLFHRRIAATLGMSAALACGASAQGNYSVGEGVGTNSATANGGPVRMAHISYLSGPVAFRPSESADWSSASSNLPFRQGAQIWAQKGSRAELQFDDGTVLRLGGGAVATLQTLYSDDKGEFTEVKLTGGLASANMRNKLSEYQFDTPNCSVKAYGPGSMRVGVGNATEVAVHSGECQVETPQGQKVLQAGEHVVIGDQSSPISVSQAPASDSWDDFDRQRDSAVIHHDSHLPPNIDMVAGNLDSYGDWRQDPQYGAVWAPRGRAVGWRPYHHGHWVWVSPFGWTWCDNEPWGWAPSHYGTWVHEPYGWAWSPGPVYQYWSPAVVQFTEDGDDVAWCPLAPAEVVYPSAFSIGFHSGNWSLFFSIGQAACYFPAGPTYCVARPWGNVFANSTTNITNVTNVTNIYNVTNVNSNNVYGRGAAFVPRYAGWGGGVTLANRAAFANGGSFRAASGSQSALFKRGMGFKGAPGGPQLAGPLGVRPTSASFASHGSFGSAGRPPKNLVGRPVYRAAVPTAIAMHSGSLRGGNPPSRPASVARSAGGPTQNRYARFNSVSSHSGPVTMGGRTKIIRPAPKHFAPTATAKSTNAHGGSHAAPAHHSAPTHHTASHNNHAHTAGRTGGAGMHQHAQHTQQTHHASRPSHSGGSMGGHHDAASHASHTRSGGGGGGGQHSHPTSGKGGGGSHEGKRHP